MKNFFKYTAFATVASLFAACNSDIDMSVAQPVQLSEYDVTTVITVNEATATRTTLSETQIDRNLDWAWEDGDVVYCTSKTGQSRGTLVASEANGASATFKGTISLAQGETTEELSFHYLGKGFGDFSQLGTAGTIDIAEQDGALSSLVSRDVLTSSDYVKVTVTDKYAFIPDFTLEHLTSVGHFSVKLPGDQNIASIVVSGDNFANTADFNFGTRQIENQGLKDGTEGITVNGQNDFYVTLLPAKSVNFHFDVVSESGNVYQADLCYDGTTDPVKLDILPGYYYRRNAGVNEGSDLQLTITDRFEYVLSFKDKSEAIVGTVSDMPETMRADGPGSGSVTFTIPADKTPENSNLALMFNKYFVENSDGSYTWYAPGDQVTLTKENATLELTADWKTRPLCFLVGYNMDDVSENTTYAHDFWSAVYMDATVENQIGKTYTFKFKAGDYKEDMFDEDFITSHPTRDGYILKGWEQTAEDGTVTQYAHGEEVTLTYTIPENPLFNEYTGGIETIDVTKDYRFVLKAIWEKQEVEYTLNFDANKPDGVTEVSGDLSPVKVKSTMGNVEFTFDKRLSAKQNVKFLGWATSATAKTPDVTSPYSVTFKDNATSVTVYAVWDADNTSGTGGDIIGVDPLQ